MAAPKPSNLMKQVHYYKVNNPDVFCSSCKVFVSRQDGSYVVFNNGKNQKWVCNKCQNRSGK